MGAEQAANKDGTIPAWTRRRDRRRPPAGSPARSASTRSRPTSRCSRSTPPTSTSTRTSSREGQLALVKQLKGYRMDVYPTRRSCGFPDFVYERTKTTPREAQARGQRLGPREGHRRGGAVPDPEERRRGDVELQDALDGRGPHRALLDDLLEQGAATSRRWCRTSGRPCPFHNRQEQGSSRTPAASR